MERILTPDNWKAGHEAAKRREQEEAEQARRWGWKPGDPPIMSQALAMDMRHEEAMEAARAPNRKPVEIRPNSKP